MEGHISPPLKVNRTGQASQINRLEEPSIGQARLRKEMLSHCFLRLIPNGTAKSLAFFLVGLCAQPFPAVGLAAELPRASPALHTPCLQRKQTQEQLKRAEDTKLSYPQRRASYSLAIDLCPEEASLYTELSTLMLEHRDFNLALSWIRRGLHWAPKDPSLNLNLGVALLVTGHPEDALKTLRRVPRSGKSQFYVGMACRALDDHSAAQKALSEAWMLGYQHAYLLYSLIEQDRALRDEAAGLDHFKLFWKRFPNSAWLHVLLGDAYTSQHDLVKAREEYEQALGLDPTLPAVHFQLGKLAWNRADYDTAAKYFRQEITLNPLFAEAYLYLGATAHRMGRNTEALRALKQAVTRNPNSILAYRELAAVQIAENQHEAALRTLKVAEKRFPREAAFPAQFSRLLHRLGRFEEASRQMELAEKLRRENPAGRGEETLEKQ